MARGVDTVTLASGGRSVTLDAEEMHRVDDMLRREAGEPRHLSPELVAVIDQALSEAVQRLERGKSVKEAVSVGFALAEDADAGEVKIVLTLKGAQTRTAEVFANSGQLRLPAGP